MSNSNFGIIDRAKEAFRVKSNRELADRLGTAESNISNWKSKNELPIGYCKQIVDETGCSLDWLILGKDTNQSGNSKKLNNIVDSETVSVPLYDAQVSAGSGTYVDHEEIVQQIPFDKQWLSKEGLYPKDLACLPIHGDSMSPNLLDGDIVLVNHAVKSGDGVFVLRMAEMLRIKRLQWFADGRLRISSDNPIYNEEIINPRDMPDFAILGACHTKIGRVM